MQDERDLGLGQVSSDGADEQTLQQQEAELAPPIIDVRVAADKMAAYVRVRLADRDQPFEPEQLLDYLKAQDITYGICEKEIQDFCKFRKFFLELTCAKGKPQIDGRDGYLNYHFDLEPKLKPREREDGGVDYNDLGLIRYVNKGDVLCTLTPPTEGEDGIDIYGKVVQFRPGRRPDFPGGSNTEVSEDRLQLVSAVDGCIEYKNQIISVSDVYVVRGDVDHSSGNIIFPGTIMIYGDVREGFRVQSDKDVVITGMVEGATVEAGQSITISAGMSGMGRGKLVAGGIIKGKYFENTKIESGQDVCAQMFMNCDVVAAGAIIASGSRKSALIGGRYQSSKLVYAGTLGTDTYYATEVAVQLPDSDGADKDQMPLETLRNKCILEQDELNALEEKLSALTSDMEKLKSSKALINFMLKQKQRSRQTLKELVAELEKREQQVQRLEDFKVVVLQRAYPGVKITIGHYKMRLEQEFSNSKFYANEDGIVCMPVSPADKIS